MLKIKGTSINYIDYGKKDGIPIVLLHGWGQNIEMMKPIGDSLKNDFRIIIIDFPGFGESEEPKEAWSLDDYVMMLHDFLKEVNAVKPILIAHSFGGRVSIKYASLYETRKLILCGSPIKSGNQKETLTLKLFRSAKKIPGMKKIENVVKKHVGSTDYRNATPIMRETLVKVLKSDLTLDAKKIKCPTILIWGSEDKEAPIEEGKELEGLIEDAALITYPGLGHYAYLEKIGQTNSIISAFINKDRK